MMRILLSPQVNDSLLVLYAYDGEKIVATIGDQSDTFDFSGFPDGEVFSTDIETELPLNPIMYAKRENGILSVQIINFIREDSGEELKYPEWLEV